MFDTNDSENTLANCWLQVDCLAIANNLAALRRGTKSRFMAVIKNNGYGLSLIEYARLLTGLGVEELAVGSIDEALALRKNGIDASLLLLTPLASAEAARELLQHDVTLTVGSRPQAEAAQQAARATGIVPKIHVKIDTGLGRYGFLPEELQHVCSAVAGMDVQGIYTHFSSPYSDRKKTKRQFDLFMRSVAQLKCNGLPSCALHCCASGGLLNFPEMHLDIVRAGSAIIGRVPDAKAHGLSPAVCLKAPVAAIKPARPGAGIGYRNSVGLRGSARVGILSVGCACGLPPARRAGGLLKARQYAVINNQSAEILGPLGIGALAVDLTGIRCSEGDLARLDVNPLYCAASIERLYDRGGLGAAPRAAQAGPHRAAYAAPGKTLAVSKLP